MNRGTRLRKKLLILLVPALVGVTYLGSTVLSSSTGKKNRGIVKVNNLTHSCELLNVERHKDHINLSILNNGDKAIMTYVLTSWIDSKTVFTFREEFAFSEDEERILPGQGQNKVIGIPTGLNRQAEINLNLAAVIYEDHSSEGDPNIIRDVTDNRLGQKLQLMKALPVIEKLSRLSDAEVGSYLIKTARHDLEAALAAPDIELLIQLNQKSSSNEANTESEQFELGVQAGKEAVFQKYQELKDLQEKQETSALRESILDLRTLYAKMIARL